METINKHAIAGEYSAYLQKKEFPCIAAKAALARNQVICFVADHLGCPKDDNDILKFLYNFVDEYRNAKELYNSAAVIFAEPTLMEEEVFDELLWQRLQALSNLDAKNYAFDKRVDSTPSSPNFSFSIKQEAFYVIGLHRGSSRKARQFDYPTLVFNPHAQFEELRETAKYNNLKNVVRKRDVVFSGTVNPMLHDFGKFSEVFQYSGRQYEDTWQCPLKINHATTEDNTTS